MKSQGQKTLYVNPVPKISSQGRDKQTYSFLNPKTGELVVTKSMAKTREFGATVELSFPINYQKNRLETGLDIMVTNPFYELDPQQVMENYNLSNHWRERLDKIVSAREIKKQTLYEIYDDVQPDFYTSEIHGDTIFNNSRNIKDTREPSFLQKFKVILYDGPNRFTDDTPRGRLAIECLKVNGKIAPNKKAINSALHLFYISEENEAEIEKSKKQDIIYDATYEMVRLQREASEFKNYQVAILLTTNQNRSILKGTASADKVKRSLNDYISESNHQMDNIDKFMKVIDLLKTKEGRKRFEVMYLVQQAINTDIITVRDGYYIWNSKATEKNMYKHSNFDKLISLLQIEMDNFNPDDRSVQNWYGELLDEVKLRGIRFE